MTPVVVYQDSLTTLYHGDCRDVLPTLIEPIALILTDPPYGIALRENGRNGYDWSIAGDESQEVGQAVLDWSAARRLPTIAFASPKKPWAGQWRQHLVWDKGPAVGGGGDPKTCWKTTWELIQVARTPRLNGKRESAVLTFWVGQRDYHHHPAQKPVSLLSYLIEKTTQPGDLIVDPFMGSGSVGVACRILGRRYVGVELDSTNIEVAVLRLQQSVLPLFSQEAAD